MHTPGWRQRFGRFARFGSRSLIAVLFLAPALSLGLAEPMAQIVSAQSGAAPSDEVTTEDFQAPRFDKTIDIKDNGPADPYSSTVNVSGMGGVVIDVKLILRGFSHQRPEDVSVMLQHAGRQTVVMRQAGGETALRNTNIVFDSFAAETLPDESIVGNMAYIPHDYLEDTNPPFGQGAPTSNDTNNLYLEFFNGVTANGSWTVWVRDDQAPIAGTMTGWQLEIVTSDTDPYIARDSYQTRQGRTLKVSGNKGLLRHVGGRNEDNYTITIVKRPKKGNLKIHSDGGFRYRPKGNKRGHDTFIYSVQDDFGATVLGNGKVKIKIKKSKHHRHHKHHKHRR